MKTVSVWGWYNDSVNGTHQAPITSAEGRTFDKAWSKAFQHMDYLHERMSHLPSNLFWADSEKNLYRFSYLPKVRA